MSAPWPISGSLKEFPHKIDKEYDARDYEGPPDTNFFFSPQNTLGEIELRRCSFISKDHSTTTGF